MRRSVHYYIHYEVSLFQGWNWMQDFSWGNKMCPCFRGYLIEGFHCICIHTCIWQSLFSHHVRGRRGLVRLQWSSILAPNGRGSVGPSGRSPIPSCRRSSISSSWQRLARRAVHHSEQRENATCLPNCFAVAQNFASTIGHRLPDLRCVLFRVPSFGPFLQRYSVAAEVLLNLTKLTQTYESV